MRAWFTSKATECSSFQYLVPARDARQQGPPLDHPRRSGNAHRASRHSRAPSLVGSVLGDAIPSYFIYGPLVFTEASDDYVRYLAYNDEPGSRILANLYSGNPPFTRYGDNPAFPGERIVIVAHPMFPHKIGRGYNEPYADSIGEVNGTRVRN